MMNDGGYSRSGTNVRYECVRTFKPAVFFAAVLKREIRKGLDVNARKDGSRTAFFALVRKKFIDVVY